MTPLAIRMWERAQYPDHRQAMGDLLSGTQFFDCHALAPFLDVRMRGPDDRPATLELLEAELPAKRTWLEFGKKAALITDDDILLHPKPNAKLRLIYYSEQRTEFSTFVMADGKIDIDQANSGYERDASIQRHLDFCYRATWFSIEAMQTPGGLCHRIHHNPSRQVRRSSERSGKPCHKWIEIRLGRGKKSGGGHKTDSGRTVAWHYRRGHRVEHPNPNYPKWRKGCWVGDTDAGIRTHNYVVETPA